MTKGQCLRAAFIYFHSYDRNAVADGGSRHGRGRCSGPSTPHPIGRPASPAGPVVGDPR